ncbi:MAG: alpha/beta hydrolase [Thiovulaceae bacterium]|nr:alpha/beta hydrolase [Sulfurimonadaceae bacterium]
MIKRLGPYLLGFLFIPLFFTSCAISDIKAITKNIKQNSNIAKIDITINSKNKNNPNIIVFLTRKWADSYEIINYNIVKKNNKISFYVEPDSYRVFAFEDVNNDSKYTKGEYIASSESLYVLSRDEFNIELDLRPYKKTDDFDKDSFSLELDNSSAHLGDIVPLNSEIYSRKNSSKGFLKPFEFVKEVPYGIFLLKKYTPNKKPILFVHGISGSPEDFSYLINHIDDSKYQIFVAYYPSGMSADIISNHLANNLNQLYREFRFKKISIVAHSLGGIIARDMLNNLNENKIDIVDKFITMSAPFKGDMMAGLGVEHSPLVIPIWRDLDPSSNFLKNLFRTRLNKQTKAYLFFGIKGLLSSDGTVSISSQIEYKAQDEAVEVRGFNESHMSILKTKRVSDMLNRYLNE